MERLEMTTETRTTITKSSGTTSGTAVPAPLTDPETLTALLTTLVEVYDASVELERVFTELVGGIGDGALAEVMKVSDAIQIVTNSVNETCRAEQGMDWEKTLIGRTLDGGGDVQERVKRLMM